MMLRRAIATAALGLAAWPAMSAPELLTTITHDYGTGTGQVKPLSQQAGSCDTLGADAVTVRTPSNAGSLNCGRFADQFSFAALSYGSIDRLVLTLDFASTNGGACLFGFCGEQWRVRSASGLTSAPVASSSTNVNRAGARTEQSFVFTSASLGATLFNDIVSSGSYYLWFQHEGVTGNQNFALYDVSLQVWGTPSADAAGRLPEPASLALASLALVGAGLASRRRRD